MTSRLFNLLAPLVATLVFAVQSLTAVHAIEYGADPHEHDGVICELALLGERQNDQLAPDDVDVCNAPERRIEKSQALRADVISLEAYIRPSARAPPVLS